MNTLDLISTVRVHLGRPSPDKVRVSDILIKMSSVTANYRTLLKSKDQWNYYKTAQFSIAPNQNDFDLIGLAPDFSKALSIEWLDPKQPNQIGIEIPIVNPGDLDQAVIMGWNFRSSYGTESSGYGYPTDMARAFTILGNIANSKAVLRCRPTPLLETYKYLLYYEPANTQIQGLSDDLQFPDEFWYLLGYLVARELLGHCDYPIDNFNQRRQSMAASIQLAEENFNKWANQKKVQNVRTSRPYRKSGGGHGGLVGW